MDMKPNSNRETEYLVGKTRYQVTPVFREAPSAEYIEQKIKRLILSDKAEKPASA